MTRFVGIGRTERRVVLAILVTAILPLISAIAFAGCFIRQASQSAFNPEFDEHLERALGVYADLVKSMKSSMRNETEAMAMRADLQLAARKALGGSGEQNKALQSELTGIVQQRVRTPSPTDALSEDAPPPPQRSHILSATIESPDGELLAEWKRPEPVDTAIERPFTVQRQLGEGEGLPTLTVVFAADNKRLGEMEGAQAFAQGHRELGKQHRREYLDQSYVRGFGVILVFTVLLSVIVGILVVRPLTRRIKRMADATRPVAEGDLTVRVDAVGKDEIADLARAFNHMLETLDRSRARIEFLNRIAEWQNMARRLAHEIKNPLTPIQLAVEECHRRYGGDDPSYKELMRTTVDIVVEEVAALRRLVTEFAEFARMPRAQLEPGDLGEYLREQQPRLERGELPERKDGEPPAVELRFELDPGPMPVALDAELMYRALVNLVANAAQAIDGATPAPGRTSGLIRLGARRAGEQILLEIEDNGPGIDPELGPKVFDPYRTTKKDGTGLGLTIVKKIVMEHGGQIDVDDSPLGGARFRLRLPLGGTSESEAALAQSEAALVSG